ncbi:tetratricopeptide repeat protein [Sphingobacterium griseoflavum]|uniref:Tetratricopeptide repeat protein n=1 Tax=Sphingobacterium griseoflavum TaxID=1474952 RepID=A0ABQ3HX41_9SPHI|nr:hypothetical protein [Sphingobacterium griseoflavum]GHE28803.1 hypothetical protein GCM10017764_09210 [Sphingobacterium griseoflavum]
MKNKLTLHLLKISVVFIMALLFVVPAGAQTGQGVLNGIEKKIDDAFGQAFVTKKPDQLERITKLLKEQKKSALTDYWLAYAYYLNSLYYDSMGDADEAESTLSKGMELLKSGSQSSESYALMGTMQNYSIKFMNMLSANKAAEEATRNLSKSIRLEPKNLRGYLGLGLQDYYTPPEFGGGTKTEGLLKKALSMPDQPTKNPTMPSWGRKEAYTTLISYYIKKKDLEKAKQYYKEASAKYPNDYRLLSLSKDLL